MRETEGLVQGVRHGLRLNPVADPERGDGREERERDRQPTSQPRSPETVFEVVHRTAGLLAARVGLAIAHPQDGLGVLGRHADQPGDPHPEESPRTAGGDGRGHADDVARPDRRGERRHERLEVRDVAFAVGLSALDEREPERVPQTSELEPTEQHGVVETREQQKKDEGNPPYPTLDRLERADHG